MILFLYLLTSLASGATQSAPAIKAKVASAIEQARQKMQEHDRAAASAILLQAISDENSYSRQQEMIRELHKLATLFITNEGQRAYELAESVRFSGQDGYMTKYEEARKLEGANWNIQMSQALGYLSQKNCKKALAYVQEAELADPYKAESKLLRYRLQACVDITAITAEQENEFLQIKEPVLLKKTIQAQKAYAEGKTEQALKFARETTQADKNFPMGYYWAWKTLSKETDVGIDEAQKYLSLCKNISAALRRKYSLEPELCIETDLAEDFLKKAENQLQ